MSRRRALSVVLAGFLCLMLATCAGGSSTSKRAGVAPPSPAVGTVVAATLPAAIARIPLTEANGTRTSLAAFQVKTVMIADFMTLCSDICPMISANTVTVARELTQDDLAGRTALLEISIDPRRDTPARLRAYQRLYGRLPSNWLLLRASPTDTKKLWRYFGIYVHRVREGSPPDKDWLTGKPLTYDVAHSDDVVFLNEQGTERFVIDGSPDSKGHPLPATLRRGLSSQGLRLRRHPNPAQDWSTEQAMQVVSWLLDRHLGSH